MGSPLGTDALWVRELVGSRQEVIGPRCDGSKTSFLTRLAFAAGAVAFLDGSKAGITLVRVGPNSFTLTLTNGDPIPAGYDVQISGYAPDSAVDPVPPVPDGALPPVYSVDNTVTEVGQTVTVGSNGVWTCSDTSEVAKMPVLGLVHSFVTASQARIEGRTGFSITHAGWSFTPKDAIWASGVGGLTQDQAKAAALANTQLVGYAISPTQIAVSIGEPTE